MQGWETNRGAPSQGVRDIASRVSWREPASQPSDVCLWCSQPLTEHLGATWCSFLLSETPLGTMRESFVLRVKGSVSAGLLGVKASELRDTGERAGHLPTRVWEGSPFWQVAPGPTLGPVWTL